MIICYSCKSEIDVSECVSRSDVCPDCDADLHCCRNCCFYDEGLYNECRETQAERVVDKERSNFCDFFTADDSGQGHGLFSETTKRNPLDDLFKK